MMGLAARARRRDNPCMNTHHPVRPWPWRPVLALFAAAFLPGLACAEWLYRDAAIMGTRCVVELWSDDNARGEAAIKRVFDDMRWVDATMSPYKPDSELSQLNARAAREPVKISKDFFDLLGIAHDYSQLTHGAFDITYASVGYLYDYRKHLRPSDTQIAALLPAIDYRHVILLPQQQAVRFSKPGVRIDLGGIAKGWAVDRGIAILKSAGFDRAMVNAGGDTRIMGDRFGKPWVVGVRDPDHKDQVILRIPLTDSAISTSGDYERFFDEGGVRYHHILDPHTGKSARKVRSVSILSATATRTDALTKSVFVLGPKAGLDFINTLPDVDAVVVTLDRKILYSKGLAPPSAAAK
jgi:thiamine biosynthesis lipoprotein